MFAFFPGVDESCNTKLLSSVFNHAVISEERVFQQLSTP